MTDDIQQATIALTIAGIERRAVEVFCITSGLGYDNHRVAVAKSRETLAQTRLMLAERAAR